MTPVRQAVTIPRYEEHPALEVNKPWRGWNNQENGIKVAGMMLVGYEYCIVQITASGQSDFTLRLISYIYSTRTLQQN